MRCSTLPHGPPSNQKSQKTPLPLSTPPPRPRSTRAGAIPCTSRWGAPSAPWASRPRSARVRRPPTTSASILAARARTSSASRTLAPTAACAFSPGVPSRTRLLLLARGTWNSALLRCRGGDLWRIRGMRGGNGSGTMFSQAWIFLHRFITPKR